MSTHAALVHSLEYYMADLVDCFEDFVKKSLLVISVALGTIILMIMYVLKVLSERAVSPPNIEPSTTPASRCREYNCAAITNAYRAGENEPVRTMSDTTIESDTESTNDPNRFNQPEPVTSNYLLNAEKTASFSAQVSTSRPSFDEKVLREIGLSSCSKPCNTSERTMSRNDSESRSNTNNPQTQTCIEKHHLSNARPCSKYIAIRTSCCSMCCVDDDRR